MQTLQNKVKLEKESSEIRQDKYYLHKNTWRKMNTMTLQTSSSASNAAESASDSARILTQMQACIEQLESQCCQ